MTTTTTTNMTFQLKGGLFPITTLQIYSADLLILKEQLLEKIQQAPNFFHYAPIVLDFRIANQPNSHIDFAELKTMLNEIKFIPVGVKNISAEQAKIAAVYGFAILKDAPAATNTTPATSPQPVVNKPQNTKIITSPVRSGQQIYAPDGDLIVINQVSPGAELIADGSIHVYGPLRGRALAGINGNREARIFCQSLEAEIISVAGDYKVSEDIEKQAWKIAAQIYIHNDRLQISAL